MPAPKRRTRPRPAASTPAAAETVLVTFTGADEPHIGCVHVPAGAADGSYQTFPLDQSVETSSSTADRLAALAGHTFHIEPARPEGGM